jgi:hypothetical protein
MQVDIAWSACAGAHWFSSLFAFAWGAKLALRQSKGTVQYPCVQAMDCSQILNFKLLSISK